jgi:ERCC4-type nuclease
MEMIVDTREDPEYYDFLVNLFPQHTFIWQKLDEGDYESSRVLVERKTLADLYGSIMGSKDKKGRLPDQISRLAMREDKITFLMVTGNLTDTMQKLDKDAGVRINPDVIYGQIASLMVKERIHTLWFEDDWNALAVMTKFMQKVEEGKHMVPTKREPNNLIARLLQITPMQAEHMKILFGSISNIAAQPEEQLQRIVGIGPAKATNIKRILNELW